MTTNTILRYLVGDANAIQKVASSKSALSVGAVLVLLTAIARNYDQTFILEKPFMWLLGPLLFSIVSGTLIFATIYFLFVSRHLTGDRTGVGSQYLSFLGLFWMTAPIAWLYAIPVERFLASYQATQANITLLAVVALWRVALMARVFNVIQGVPFWRGLLWVLLPASIEVFVLYIFGGAFAKAIMSSMGGMRNSPEEELLLTTLYRSAGAAFWIGLACLIALPILQNKRALHCFPSRTKARGPWGFVLLASIVWIGVAIHPQKQVQRNAHVDHLVAEGRYRESIEFLSRHQPSDFAPGRTLPPKPYEFSIYEQLPSMFEGLDGTERKWVREMLLQRLDVMLSHFGAIHRSENIDAIYSALAQSPEGRLWLQTNRATVVTFANKRIKNGVVTATDEILTLQSNLVLLQLDTGDLSVPQDTRTNVPAADLATRATTTNAPAP